MRKFIVILVTLMSVSAVASAQQILLDTNFGTTTGWGLSTPAPTAAVVGLTDATPGATQASADSGFGFDSAGATIQALQTSSAIIVGRMYSLTFNIGVNVVPGTQNVRYSWDNATFTNFTSGSVTSGGTQFVANNVIATGSSFFLRWGITNPTPFTVALTGATLTRVPELNTTSASVPLLLFVLLFGATRGRRPVIAHI